MASDGMMEHIETSSNRRSYDTAQRRLQSAASRQRIVDEARRLFLAQGYRTTTIAEIAGAAGVNPDTVYRLVGRKPMVLRELIEQALSGTDHAVAGEDRIHVQAMMIEPDPVVKLDIYAAAVRETHGRMAPLFLALRDASSTEPEAEQVWKEIGERRAANMRKLVRNVRAATTARYSTSTAEAADTVWALNSPELYVMLTVARGWTPQRYERWLATSMRRLVLD
ncbi:MAG: TetR/AcrR family transcriptional regulator [Ilumatobacteraceae bacterium]|nr:TetR/AcrR family transcriptional regulator [Ilumatobacteraceae bacterium]